MNERDWIAAAVQEREALVRSQQQLALAQRMASVGSWEWEVGPDHARFSDELYRILEVDRATFRPSLASFLELVIEADRDRVTATVREAVEQGRGFEFECRVGGGTGPTRVLHICAEPVTHGERPALRMYGTAQDITRRWMAEDELRRQKETLELVSRATNDAVWDWDVATGRVTWSHGISAYGYGQADVLPTVEWRSGLLHPDDLTRILAVLDVTLASTDTALTLEYRIRRKDGGYAKVLDRSFVIRDDAGAALRMVGSLLDLSHRERAEELARRGAAASELLARASHELRTPLNAILGFSDLLQQRLATSLGARELRYIANIRSSGEHLLQLVDRLLQIARADSGRLELRPSVIGILGLVAPVYVEFAAAAAAAQVRLDLDVPEASVRIDLDRMLAVLRELVANALAATPAGGSVVVRATIPDDDLVLEVIDTGRGIPADAHDRVFDVFQRIHEESEAPHTGLGLALCRELVELHGGTISFESEPGKGTTFRVRLPHVAWRRDRGDRVLVVEDEPNDADLAMTVARDAGLGCEVVGTVAEARAAILREAPTAIVLDLRLPDGTGNEILDSLRELGPLVPVAVVSAYDDVASAYDGAVRMSKPIDPGQLAAWLLRVTAREVSA